MIKTLFQRSDPNKNPIFSIIIPTWNNLEYLKLCLRSIQTHSRFQHQLIIHVNEGTDGTQEWLDQHIEADVCHSQENVGVCHALNYARTLVKTDYILYLNDDMYTCPDWDYHLWEAIQRWPSNRFFYSATTLQQGSFHDKSIMSQCNFGRTIEDFDEKRFLSEWNDRPFEDWNGATWPPNVVHKEVWDMVGGYSVEFSPGMYSDPDFSMKLWKSGIREFRGIAASRVYHFEAISTNRIVKNPGARQFLMKWGLTSSTFSRHFLKRGTQYNGPLTEPKKTLLFRWDILRSILKQLGYRIFI